MAISKQYKPIYTAILTLLLTPASVFPAERANGYRGIWFELGQKSEYGDKYSGGLGTYTAKHHPLAVYSREANKTFFVYGGTTHKDKRELLAMISYYDHETGQVPRPVIVHAKENVNDPHDNPSLQIDRKGYLWVFISGRARVRPGLIYKSAEPFSIEEFELISKAEFAYPQPVYAHSDGFLLLFTKYTNGRELYWKSSIDGSRWTEDTKIASGGHYQMTASRGNTVGTAFNTHPDGVDTRTNIYYIQTREWGKSWQNIDNETLDLPLEKISNRAIVRDYKDESRLVYLKDINFDASGNPVFLYLTSSSYKPGPGGEPRIWTIAHRSGKEWLFHEVARSTHNYDMGSLYIEEDGTWCIIAPTDAGPQHWGAGGEMVMWRSGNQGKTWEKVHVLTQNSSFNHCYARKPQHAHPDFYAFWADGHADTFSESRLYFATKEGDVFHLPYNMNEERAVPVRIEIFEN